MNNLDSMSTAEEIYEFIQAMNGMKYISKKEILRLADLNNLRQSANPKNCYE